MPPPLEPDALTQLMAASPPSSVEEMREMLDGFVPLLNADLPEVGGLHENVLVREVDGARVTADVVVPGGAGPHPVLVYLHGGGWVWGSPTSHRKLVHRFAEAGYLVFSIDYRLAPEHPFPAAFEDCAHAVCWAAEEAPRFGGDPLRLAVGGDSAGGNLAAATAISLAGEPRAPRLGAALLIYGVFDFARLGPEEGEPNYESARQMTELMAGSYLGRDPEPALLADPRVSPVHAAGRLPPTHVVVGSLDPLASHAEALVRALEKADVPHEHVVVEGMPHGFVQMEFLPQARPSIDRMVAFLGRHLR